jgi:UDP-glucose 4-epimerase
MGNPDLVLVTGATGAVGPQVVSAIREAGYRIRTLSLHPPPADMVSDGIECRIGDVTNPADVRSAMQGAGAVVHLAALLHIVNPTPDMRQAYENINVGGTAVVADAAVREDVRRIVYFSTIAVYGDSRGRVMDEDTPPAPKTFYEKTKLDAERLVLRAKNRSGFPIGTVLRMAAVYGPRVKGNYRQLLKALHSGCFVSIGPGRNRRTLVYDQDVARAAALALVHPGAAGRLFNVSDGEFHPLHEIIEVMCSALGRNAPRFSLPVRPVRLAAGILESAARLAGLQSPVVRATIDKYTEDVAVDSRRIQKELGFVPATDLTTGWRDTVRDMRRAGEL